MVPAVTSNRGRRSRLNPGTIIQQLREEGFEVHVSHGRLTHTEYDKAMDALAFGDRDFRPRTAPSFAIREVGLTPEPCGGVTTVQIFSGEDEERQLLAEGIARCNPLDNYDRKKGTTIALGRAMKVLRGDIEGGR